MLVAHLYLLGKCNGLSLTSYWLGILINYRLDLFFCQGGVKVLGDIPSLRARAKGIRLLNSKQLLEYGLQERVAGISLPESK